MRKFIQITLLCLTATAMPAYAQVTVGTDEEPANGALFQMKDKGGIVDETENSTKGMIFPRVKLTQKNKLFPMLAKADGTTPADNYSATADIEKMNKMHVGLTVYNTSTTSPFKKGLYTWNGTEWKDYGGEILATNGLSNNTANQSIELGGTLSKPTTIVQGTNTLTINAGASTFGVNTTGAGKVAVNTNTLVVSGSNVAIGGTPQSNAALKIDATDKGFILPRVELSNGSDATTVPVASPDKGLVVYHTGNATLDEGIYSWNGTAWNQLISQLPPDKEPNIRELIPGSNVDSNGNHPLAAASGSSDMDKMKLLPFEEIKISEPGSYVFMVRLAGRGEATTSQIPSDIPVFLYLKKTSADGTVTSDWLDGQTCYLPLLRTNGSTGGIATLVVPKCLSGETITIYGAQYSVARPVALYHGTAPRSSRSSVIFWKI